MQIRVEDLFRRRRLTEVMNNGSFFSSEGNSHCFIASRESIDRDRTRIGEENNDERYFCTGMSIDVLKSSHVRGWIRYAR